MSAKQKLQEESEKIKKELISMREQKIDLIKKVIKLEIEIDSKEEDEKRREKRIWEIEQKECEEISEMSWQDENGNSKRREKKKELQEEIRKTKEDKKYRLNEYHLEKAYEDIIKKRLTGKWEKEGLRSERLNKEVEKLQEKIEESYEEIARLYEV